MTVNIELIRASIDMNNPYITFIYLSSPIAGSIILFIAMLLFFKKTEGDTTKCKFSFGVVSFEKEVQINVWLMRVLFAGISLTLFSYPAFRDYSEFFPTNYQMTVFFDDEGIVKALNQLTKTEIDDLKIEKEWQAKKADYLSNLNNEVEKRVGKDFHFDGTRGYLYSKGQTSFVVKKVKGWGLQKYYIQKAGGELVHTLQIPGQQSQEIKSIFELLETDDNLIDVPIVDIYLRWTAILHPEFKQMFAVSAKEEYYHHSLIAVTKIQIFPIVDVKKTIYLVRDSSDKLVPVGYAIYTQP